MKVVKIVAQSSPWWLPKFISNWFPMSYRLIVLVLAFLEVSNFYALIIFSLKKKHLSVRQQNFRN